VPKSEIELLAGGERKAYEGLNAIFGAEQLQQLSEAGQTPSDYVGSLVALARGLAGDPDDLCGHH